jgi:hypothetical protein
MVGLGPKKPPSRKGTGTYARWKSRATLLPRYPIICIHPMHRCTNALSTATESKACRTKSVQVCGGREIWTRSVEGSVRHFRGVR